MIKITEILSKPVISLLDSKTEGIVKNAIFDKNFKRLKYLVLFDNNEHQEEKTLSIQNIYSYGENAIIVKDGQDLSLELSTVKISDKLLPINNAVYTYLGKCVGKVTDILLDDKYYIKSLIIGQTEIDINEILSSGEDAVIIQDKNKKVNISNIKRKKSKKVAILDTKLNYDQKVVILNNEKDEVPSIQVKEDIQNDQENINTTLIDNQIITQENNENKPKIKYTLKDEPSLPKIMFANSDFLIGRKLEKNIYSQNKELIARKNTKITLEIINKAKMFYKLRELTKFSR